ncbi:hypothetical protein [Portibacter marinus]|uniref:hypothetical protein n=1 Tax=Portibacter marinus TaxID=2898660 RepID=UPI001F32B4D1|nr:hypothetical protein [Portibacter marinus]
MKKAILMILFATGTMYSYAQSVSFTLHNETSQSIPLKIPGVMNPNLSPFSDSGVSLKIGQKVYFKYLGKKVLLLTAHENLEGKKLNVGALINKRKEEIDSKRTHH